MYHLNFLYLVKYLDILSRSDTIGSSTRFTDLVVIFIVTSIVTMRTNIYYDTLAIFLCLIWHRIWQRNE